MKRTTRLPTLVAACALVGGLLTIATQAAASGSTAAVKPGGVFRISLQGIDYIDPALAYSTSAWALIDTTCARLMTYPDKPPPEGYRLVPEVAAAYPRRSRDEKTWTFRLRSGFRFSDGTPVRASAFKRAIQRTLAPGVESYGAQYTRDIAAVDARGLTLVVRLKRPVADFPARMTMYFFCAVPPGLPADPEGVRTFPGAGPYYVAEYRPGQRVVIKRNRFYGGKHGGTRPHHVDGFVVDLTAPSPGDVVDRIESGQADWGDASRGVLTDPERRLVAKYGINRKNGRFRKKPGLELAGYALNTSRPLFRTNPRLRRAVNLALDRRALSRVSGPLFASPTDQVLPSGLPGFKDARIYPLNGPTSRDLRRARALASGHRRGGKAILYTLDFAPTRETAQIVTRNLARIGLDVTVKPIPPQAYGRRLNAPGEPYDIAFFNWVPDYLDPFAYVNVLLDGRAIGAYNWARFDSPKYNGQMRRAARLQGKARYHEYGRLDVRLARDAAPLVPVSHPNDLTFVSKRVGCVVLRPSLDLTAVCLKR